MVFRKRDRHDVSTDAKRNVKRAAAVVGVCSCLVLLGVAIRFWWIAREFPVDLKNANGPGNYSVHLLAKPRYDETLVTMALMLLGRHDYSVHTYVEVRLSGFVLHTITVSYGGQNGPRYYENADMSWVGMELHVKPEKSSREIVLHLSDSEEARTGLIEIGP